ncbi:MAG: ABC transporter permease subunit [bacterium]|nr:ABC transporter permease subunit [bacterium]
MIRKPMPAGRKRVITVVTVILAIAGYTWASHRRHVANPKDRMVPSWSQMVEGFERVSSVDEDDHVRWIVADAKATGLRLVIGLTVSVALAFVLGILMGCFHAVEAACLWWVSALAKIPATSVIAVIFIAVGTGMEMYITVIAFGVVPILTESVFLLVRDVPDEMLWKAETLGASRTEVVWNVITRMVAPKFFDNVRLQFGPAMVYLIAAELLCAYIGFGYRINKFARQTHMEVVFPYIIALGLFGFAANWLLMQFRNRAFPWYQKGGR